MRQCTQLGTIFIRVSAIYSGLFILAKNDPKIGLKRSKYGWHRAGFIPMGWTKNGNGQLKVTNSAKS